MISRVAESCFWLHRYLERVESTARVLSVNTVHVLDVKLPPARAWRPLLIVAGEEPRFLERHGARRAEDGEAVQEYLVWDEESPTSIVSSLHGARENARTIRETISLEMWQELNGFWHWLRGGPGRRLWAEGRIDFYETVKRHCFTFHGVVHGTVLHEEPFDFMRFGAQLERAGQTARILDVKHHALGPGHGGPESAAETAEWLAILRSCSAYEPFFKRSGSSLTGTGVAEFLLLEPVFPRSVFHALTRARNFHDRIRSGGSDAGGRSGEMIRDLVTSLEGGSAAALFGEGIHGALTRIIDRLARISECVEEEFFRPGVPSPESGALSPALDS